VALAGGIATEFVGHPREASMKTHGTRQIATPLFAVAGASTPGDSTPGDSTSGVGRP